MTYKPDKNKKCTFQKMGKKKFKRVKKGRKMTAKERMREIQERMREFRKWYA